MIMMTRVTTTTKIMMKTMTTATKIMMTEEKRTAVKRQIGLNSAI